MDTEQARGNQEAAERDAEGVGSMGIPEIAAQCQPVGARWEWGLSRGSPPLLGRKQFRLSYEISPLCIMPLD
jgi:hypothetical protein